jgi:hypothetical protein
MKHLIVLLLATFSFSTFGQTAYEKGMQSAMGLWSQGKNSEAVAMFERIAAAEKDNWLPNYYVALVSTTTAFAIPKTKPRSMPCSKKLRLHWISN